MRIGVFCTNEYTTPPPQDVIYAPLQVTQQISDGLTARGHRVTVFAPKGSRMRSRIETSGLVALKKNKLLEPFSELHNERTVATYEHVALSDMATQAAQGKFDILHIHPAIRGIFYPPFVKIPVVFTLHDPIDKERNFFFSLTARKNVHYISISNAQRKPAPHLPWAGTVYNGIEPEKYPFTAKPKKHFVAIGRLVPNKGIYEAIMAAKKARVPLHIAGKPASGPYWERKIKPHLSKTIRYMGMIPYEHVPKFLSEARGLLFPIQWEEPFGLVMTEAMAGGTPVIAFRRGSVPEILTHGKNGYLAKDVNAMASAIHRIDKISRGYCRTDVCARFSVDHMIDGYERIFKRLIKK